MKKGLRFLLLLPFMAIGLFSLTPRKHYTLTDTQAIMVYQIMEVTKNLAKDSDKLSSREANNVQIAADSIQKFLVIQHNDTLNLSK